MANFIKCTVSVTKDNIKLNRSEIDKIISGIRIEEVIDIEEKRYNLRGKKTNLNRVDRNFTDDNDKPNHFSLHINIQSPNLQNAIPKETCLEVENEPRYALRKRKLKESEKKSEQEPNTKRICVRNATRKPKFIPAKKDEIKENLVVLAHLQTWSEWPAKVLKINASTVKVIFFADHLTANLKFDKIGLIGENAQLIKFLLTKKKIPNYKKAVVEMEYAQNVPSNLSLIPA